MCVKAALHSLKQKSRNALHVNVVENIKRWSIYIRIVPNESNHIYHHRKIFSNFQFNICFNDLYANNCARLFWWDLQCFVGYDETIKEWLAYCLTCINNNLVPKIWGVKFYYELKVFNFNK